MSSGTFPLDYGGKFTGDIFSLLVVDILWLLLKKQNFFGSYILPGVDSLHRVCFLTVDHPTTDTTRNHPTAPNDPTTPNNPTNDRLKNSRAQQRGASHPLQG